MTTKKPCGNSPSSNDLPKDNQDEDGAPHDGRQPDCSREEKKLIKLLFPRLESERKRSEHLVCGLLDEGNKNVKRMKASIQENNAPHYRTKHEWLKGKKVEGYNTMAKATKQAALLI